MSEPQPPAVSSEWRNGWRIVLACSLASGTGVVLLFFSFSLFVLPITAELGMTRGEFGSVQALIVAGALGAPVIGWLTDRYGVRPVFVVCTLFIAAVELAMARFADGLAAMAAAVFLLGLVGVGTTALVTTRPVTAHFRRHRGKALGLVVAGVSIATILAPTPLQWLTDTYGWRSAIAALAAAEVAVGIPAMLLLLPSESGQAAPRRVGPRPAADRDFLRDRRFWLLAISGILIGAATSGFIGQLSPLAQEEGLNVAMAALALSLFAAGQLAGRVFGGVLLDAFEPRRVAMIAILLPGTGFALLLTTHGMPAATLLAAALIGVLAGAELDIGAYFISRLFALTQYSTIYGAMAALGWIGNAAGVIGIGLLHDRFGSYASAEVLACALLVLGAGMFLWMPKLGKSA
ncbi:MAG: MFS transporter [Novosphingobium sp.]